MIRLSPVCFITPGDCDVTVLEETLFSVLEAGIRLIQYREKNRTGRDIYAIALRLRDITNLYKASLIINDRVDIALAVDADGVHLGQDDLPLKDARTLMGDRIIGISTHNVMEAVEAEKGGADYIGFGSIFHTATKDVGALQGIRAIRAVKDAVGIPVIAVGGIKVENARSVFKAGADGIAVSSGLSSGDPGENASRFLSFKDE